MNKLVFLGLVATPIFLLLVPTNAFASGIRGDSDEYATVEESRCWVNGYDSGFAGKYDKTKHDECLENSTNDYYDQTWDIGCEDSTRTEKQCEELKNKPVKIESFKKLKAENDRTCYDAGVDDGKNNRPFDEEREDGCYEFNDISGGYEGGYQYGCEIHSTESTCELKYEEKQYYCPDHPDIAACTDFLRNNSTFKHQIIQENYDIESCKRVNVTCSEEINPEKYCLETDNPVFCKSIGGLCDEDGFVKPEYPYCQK